MHEAWDSESLSFIVMIIKPVVTNEICPTGVEQISFVTTAQPGCTDCLRNLKIFW